MPELTDEERKAIASIKRLAKRWPASLWLFAGGQNGIAIMRTGPDGKRMHTSADGVDPDFCVDTVNLPADGGDW